MQRTEPMWMVRAGEAARFANDFEEKSYVGMGWPQLGDLSKTRTKEEFLKQHREAYPDEKAGSTALFVGMLYRFVREMKKNDYVVTYNPETRVYLVGQIASDYHFQKVQEGEYPHRRDVHWIGKVKRDQLTTSTKNTIGAIMALFLVKDPAKNDILDILEGSPREKPVEEEPQESQIDLLRQDVIGRGIEFIKDKLLELDWEDMQDLVAGVLRGMGYKTRVSPRGPDQGKDIVASPDGLGFEQPRIKVEVKHRAGATGSDLLRSFIGGLRQNDNGLYVSTGGFTKEARYEADRSPVPVTLIDIDQLAELLVNYYDNLDSDAKALVPLVKVYWPA